MIKRTKSRTFPKREAALRSFGLYKVMEYHDDGDLTVKSRGKLFVVTTEGLVFRRVSRKSPFK